jgi:hypothetical protein
MEKLLFAKVEFWSVFRRYLGNGRWQRETDGTGGKRAQMRDCRSFVFIAIGAQEVGEKRV